MSKDRWLLLVSLWIWAELSFGYTANKVWFEFRDDGKFRVHVNYTIPALKEYRASYADFISKKEAEKYYWDLVRGADFYPPNPKDTKFVQTKLKPEPW